MNATQEATFEDMAIDVPEPTADREVWPAGIYNARLVGLKTVAKPDWMMTAGEDEDREQWQFTYEIIDGEYAGERISAYCNRSWNEKSNAHKAAAALLGVPTLPVGVGMSTGQLAGKTCQLWISERTSKTNPDKQYNKVDKITPTPTARMRPQRPGTVPIEALERLAAKAPQGKTGGRVQIEGLPVDDPDEDIPFS